MSVVTSFISDRYELFGVQLSNRPLYALLIQFSAVCFVGALISDLAYVATTWFVWASFSIFLLAAGCIGAGVAGIVGLVDFLGNPRVRAVHLALPHALMSQAASASAASIAGDNVSQAEANMSAIAVRKQPVGAGITHVAS